MAHAPARHFRRNALAFLGALAAHVWIFHAAATQVFPPLAAMKEADATETPVEVYPRLPPPRPKPAAIHRRHAIRGAGVMARASDVASVTPLAAGADAQLSEPIRAPPQLSSGAAPQDLTDATPPAHYPINPGYWRVVEHWALVSRTELYCVEPWNIIRFMAAPCNHIYHCDTPVMTIGTDTFHFKEVVTGRNDRFNVRGGGDFTPNTLHVSVNTLGHWKILPVAFSASLDGQYLGPDCPADAKRIRQR